jgi:hypothetical protein
MPSSDDFVDGFFRLAKSLNAARASYKTLKDRKQREREAILAARRQSAGKSREELRRLVADEWSRRGLSPLPAPLLELQVDAVEARDLSQHRDEMRRDAIASLIRVGSEIVDGIRTSKGASEMPSDGLPDPFMPTDRQRTFRVDLQDDAASVLESVRHQVPYRIGGVSVVRVGVKAVTDPDGAHVVDVLFRDHRLGQLRNELAEELWAALWRPDGTMTDAQVLAYVSTDHDEGGLRLDIGAPQVRKPGESETLWDKARRFDRYYLFHCIVCDQPVDWEDGSHVLVVKGRSGHGRPVHERCLDDGARRARAEGLRWRVEDEVHD